MAIDTEAKRWSMLQVATSPCSYAHVFNPSASGLSAIERATVLKRYGGIAWDSPIAPTLPPAMINARGALGGVQIDGGQIA